jgi:PIN domain nuclease of toxin-antitoxin system
MSYSRALLLDTHAAIWLAEGQLSNSVLTQVISAGLADGVFVSPVSAWEVGLLARPRRDGQPKVDFMPDPQAWFAALLTKPIIKEAPLSPAAAIESSFLPGPFHGDPADRLLIATARTMGIPMLTRDKRILAYAKLGHMHAVRC